jgi:hypothetical protein
MASSRRRIRFEAIVRGELQEAEVYGSMTEVSLPGLPTQYVEYRVDWCFEL